MIAASLVDVGVAVGGALILILVGVIGYFLTTTLNRLTTTLDGLQGTCNQLTTEVRLLQQGEKLWADIKETNSKLESITVRTEHRVRDLEEENRQIQRRLAVLEGS